MYAMTVSRSGRSSAGVGTWKLQVSDGGGLRSYMTRRPETRVTVERLADYPAWQMWVQSRTPPPRVRWHGAWPRRRAPGSTVLTAGNDRSPSERSPRTTHRMPNG